MVGVTSGVDRFDSEDDPAGSGHVQAAVDMFGAGDLTALAADFDAATQELFNGQDNSVAWYLFGRASGKTLRDDPDDAVGANAATYVSSSTPPSLLFHGTDDNLVSPSQTLTLHEALQAAGRIAPGTGCQAW
jgi:acetyl esterase/lipase